MTNFEQVLIDALNVTEDLYADARNRVENIQQQIESMNQKLVKANDALTIHMVDLKKAKTAVKAVMPNYFDEPVEKAPVKEEEDGICGVPTYQWINQCQGILESKIERVKVTRLECYFLKALAKGMYAEPGFSDMTLEDVMNKIHELKEYKDKDIKTWKGVMSSLSKKGLVFSEEYDAIEFTTGKNIHNNIIYLSDSAYAWAGTINHDIAYWAFNYYKEGKEQFTTICKQVDIVQH